MCRAAAQRFNKAEMVSKTTREKMVRTFLVSIGNLSYCSPLCAVTSWPERSFFAFPSVQLPCLHTAWLDVLLRLLF